MTARSTFQLKLEVSLNDPIDLSPNVGHIRAIVPVPQGQGTPPTTYYGRLPSHTWTVTDSDRHLIGCLCLYASDENEQVLLWIFGENPVGRQGWHIKPAPALKHAIDELELRQRPSAQIIIAGQDQSPSSDSLRGPSDDDVVVWATLLFDSPAAEQITPGSRTLPAPRHGRKKAPPPDPIVLEARRRDATQRTDGDIDPATATASSAGRTYAAPPQPIRRTSATGRNSEETALPQGRADRPAPAVSMPSQTDPGRGKSELSMIRASDLVPERLEYLWSSHIARGKLTIVAGDPGLGKSLLAARLAAIVSRGSAWAPNEEPALKGSVIMVTTEDGLRDTIRPRLEAAGANLDAVHLLPDLDLTRNQDAFEQEIKRLPDARLVVIDPITSCLGRTNINGTADVRAVVTSLSRLAARTGVAVVAITHLNKNASGRALARILGSQAFGAVARAAYVLTKDPDDPGRRLLVPLKNNLGADDQSLAFRIEEVPICIGAAPRLAPDAEPVLITADEALTVPRTTPSTRSILEQAKEFLSDFLAAGPREVVAVQAAAATAAISGMSLQRAKKALGVQSSKSAMEGGWQWMLPLDTKMINPTEDDQCDPMSTFGADDHLRSPHPDETIAQRGDHQ